MSWFALKTGPNFNNPVGERIAKWVVSRNWNFLMVCGQKRKFFLTMKKKEVRDLINESMIEGG